MKRTSGRIGVGLVLVSILVGACITERESGEASVEAVTRPEAAIPNARDAKDVVVALRSQIDRAFGKTNTLAPETITNRGSRNSFDIVGARTTSVVEFLGMGGVTGKVATAADVVLPAQADGAFQLHDVSSGAAIEVGLIGATTSAREDADGYTVYRAGYAKGAHIVHRTTPQGTEDYVFFPDTLPDSPELRYEVALGENIAGLRLVERTIEMLDASGAPRLRMAPPYAIDGDGRRLALNVEIEGCAYDSSTDLPWDRPVVAPGAKHCIVHLSWDANARAPLAVDPAWARTGELTVPRMNATSAEIPGTKARVIVVGGDPGDPSMAHKTTEVFDEGSNTWAMFKSLANARTQHAMVASTGMVGGQVVAGIVVTGGKSGEGVTATVEKLDLGGGGWTSLTAMQTPRYLHTATAVESGKILVAGGVDNNGMMLSSAELFSSTANNGSWVSAAAGQALSAARIGHTSTVSKNNVFVVVVGGKSSTSGASSNTIDYCDTTGEAPNCALLPVTLVHGRANHKAIRDIGPNGVPRIYFIGGESGGTPTANVELFDANNKVFIAAPAALNQARFAFDAISVTLSPLLGLGNKIVVSGGYGEDQAALQSVEILDTFGNLNNKLWQTGPNMLTPRARHTMASLSDGRILAIGGVKDGKGSSEVMQCNKNDDCPMDRPFCADGFCCDTACDGVCEACNSNAPGHTVGTCFPIAGEPREGHGTCKSDDPLNAKCVGQCGGFERTECVYPEGKPCGTECAEVMGTPQSSTKSLTCSDTGICDVPGFETSCGNLTCADDKLTCNVKCTPMGGCIKGYECNVTSGSCVEAQAQCGTRPDPKEDIEREVLESVADPTMVVEECGNFRCRNSACLKVCDTAYDCISNPNAKPDPIIYVCNDSRQCVPLESETTDGESSGCSTSPANESSRFGWLAVLAMAGAAAVRRQRARA